MKNARPAANPVSVIEMCTQTADLIVEPCIEDIGLLFMLRRIHHNHQVDHLGYCVDLEGAVQMLELYLSNPYTGKGYIPNPQWMPRTSFISPSASIYIVLDRVRKEKLTFAEAMKSVRRPCKDVAAGAINYSHTFTSHLDREVKKRIVKDLFANALQAVNNPLTA